MTAFLKKLQLSNLWSDNDLMAWLILLVAIFAGIVAGRVSTWILGRIARRCEARGWAGRAQIVVGLIGPVSLALLTLALSLGVSKLKMGEFLLNTFIPKTRDLLYTIAVFWYAYNLVDIVDVAIKRLRRGGDSGLDRQVAMLVSRALRVFLVVVGTLFVAESVFDKDIGAWLAGLGIAGLAVSLAAQDSIKHLFGSITILLDRSFLIGDRIISCNYDGIIQDIGFRSTKIRTPIGHLVTIPNSNLVNSAIENVSRRQAVRRVITLLISGKTQSEKLREALGALTSIFEEDGIAGSVRPKLNGILCPPQVIFEDIQASNFKLTVIYWYAPANDPGFTAHAERVNLRIIEELQRLGVDLA
jgi:MscS family membrane protein